MKYQVTITEAGRSKLNNFIKAQHNEAFNTEHQTYSFQHSLYRVYGSYYADDELKHFDDDVFAFGDDEAVEIIVGRYALEANLSGKIFMINRIVWELK